MKSKPTVDREGDYCDCERCNKIRSLGCSVKLPTAILAGQVEDK